MSQPEQRLTLKDGRIEIMVPQGTIEIITRPDEHGGVLTEITMHCPQANYVVREDPTRANGTILAASMREKVIHIIPLEDSPSRISFVS